MALIVEAKFKPSGNFKVADAEDIAYKNGSLADHLNSLEQDVDDFQTAPPVLPGAETIEPEKYYEFGTVDSLNVTLAEKNDGMAHEYTFEFTPSDGFLGLTVTPEPVWLREPQWLQGKRCVVSILRGLAVMGCG